MWNTRVESYVQSCASVLNRIQNAPTVCNCPDKSIPVVRCGECTPQDEFVCLRCAVVIHEDFTCSDHHLTHLCPSCGMFGLLFLCPSCENGLLRCASCLEKGHRRSAHAYAYEALVPVTQRMLCDSADMAPPPTVSVAVSSTPSPVGGLTNLMISNPAPLRTPIATLATSASLDAGFVHMLHARAVVEKIGLHVVIECFRQRWNAYFKSFKICNGCGSSHDFDSWKTACLWWVTGKLHINDSAQKCAKALNDPMIVTDGIAGVLHKYFDLGALCNFMRRLDKEYFPHIVRRDRQAFFDLAKVRGDVYHKQCLSEPELAVARSKVKALCLSLLQPYPYAAWDESRIDSELADIAEFGGDLLKEFREQILRECRRDTALQVADLMATSNHTAHVVHSRQIANVLLDPKCHRVLVIPKLEEGQTNTRNACSTCWMCRG